MTTVVLSHRISDILIPTYLPVGCELLDGVEGDGEVTDVSEE